MRHGFRGKFHLLRVTLLLTMVVLFTTALLLSMASSMRMYRERVRQNSIVKGVEEISQASNKIIEELSDKAVIFANEQYDSLYELVRGGDDNSLTEDELEDYFKSGFANKFKECYPDDLVYGILSDVIKQAGIENVTVIDDRQATLNISRDETGKVYGISLDNVTLSYESPGALKRVDTISYEIKIPEAIFYDGNEDLFDYCMVSQKGVYITGETSSVMGDIYAGDHTEEESRDAELEYGETVYLGGLNILATQLAVEGKRIVTKGDININGSFVIFSSGDDILKCFGHRMNKIEGYKAESMYSLDGVFYSLDKTDEKALDEYYEYVNRIDYATNRLELISGVYDSQEDDEYEGEYRKIISDSDVDIKEDYTGIVVTSQNVIIERNVNFEGLIICGDRLYVMGNNNIVANRNVLRNIVAEEFEQNYEAEAKDYIGGIVSPGLHQSQYSVIPYR